jgi:DNA-binding Lrp family transcriptional regulator
MTKDARRTSRSEFPVPSIGVDIISRVLSILESHPAGIKVRDLIKELGVSRLTLLKWLHRLEEDGLLYKTHAMHGKKGRPEVLYHLSDDPVRTLSNPEGTFVVTGIGKHKGQGKYHLFENSVDFPRINKSIIELDEKIFASSIINKTGTLLVRDVRRGYESRLGLDKDMFEKWGAWVAIIAAVAEQEDKLLTELEYVAIGHKDFKGLIIPFNKLGLLVRLTVQKTTEATYITETVKEHLNHLVHF